MEEQVVPFVEHLMAVYETDFDQAQIAAAADVVVRRYRHEVAADAVRPEDVAIAPHHEQAVAVTIRGVEDGPVYADPAGEYCVRWGNKDMNVPPEGRTVDRNGDAVYGVR